MLNFRVWDLWAEPLPHGDTVKDCARGFSRKVKALGHPAFWIPAERMAVRTLMAPCQSCRRCEPPRPVTVVLPRP